MKNLMLALLTSGACGLAIAKLPPPAPDAQAAAAAAKDKAAWGDKIAAYKLCLAQNKVAAQYLKEKGGKKPDVAVPPCADPGQYVPSTATTTATGNTPAAPATAAGAAAVQSAQAPAPAKK